MSTAPLDRHMAAVAQVIVASHVCAAVPLPSGSAEVLPKITGLMAALFVLDTPAGEFVLTSHTIATRCKPGAPGTWS